MNDTELIKTGLKNRIKRLNLDVLCLEAQKDYLDALEKNDRAIQLCFLLAETIIRQANEARR